MKRIDGEHYEEKGKLYEVVNSNVKAKQTSGLTVYETCCHCAFGDDNKYPAGCSGSREVNQACVKLNNSASRMRDYKYFVEVR